MMEEIVERLRKIEESIETDGHGETLSCNYGEKKLGFKWSLISGLFEELTIDQTIEALNYIERLLDTSNRLPFKRTTWWTLISFRRMSKLHKSGVVLYKGRLQDGIDFLKLKAIEYKSIYHAKSIVEEFDL